MLRLLPLIPQLEHAITTTRPPRSRPACGKPDLEKTKIRAGGWWADVLKKTNAEDAHMHHKKQEQKRLNTPVATIP